jgi:glycosyltransferase involved in cell wall biosynthesis
MRSVLTVGQQLSPKDVSVIIATFKRPHLLEQALNSFLFLDTSGLEWEVLIVDNADDSATKKVVTNFSNQISKKYLVEKNRGKNNALNRAIPEARGEIVVFTDDDILADAKWLKEIWKGTRRWPEHYVFGGRSLASFPDGQGMPFEHEFFTGAFAIADWDIPEGPYEADKVWGLNMAIRALIFNQGWRFNPKLGPNGTDRCILGDETELTGRLSAAGFNALYLPKALVFHQIQKESLNYKWLYKRAFILGQQNAYFDSKSNLPINGRIPRYLIQRLLKSYVLFFMAMFSKDQKLKFERGVSYWETRGSIYYYRNSFHDM